MHHWPIQFRRELKLPKLNWQFQFDPLAIQGHELSWAEYMLTRSPVPVAVDLQFTRIYRGSDWQVFAPRSHFDAVARPPLGAAGAHAVTASSASPRADAREQR